MNYEPLNHLHGAPLRLRVENQLGFKMVKWIQTIEFVEDARSIGIGEGGSRRITNILVSWQTSEWKRNARHKKDFEEEGEMFRIGVAADHGGFELKGNLPHL